MTMTYRIAHAAGTDAANRQMRAAGRDTWNQEDAALAAATLRKCFPLCVEHPEIEPELCGCVRCPPPQFRGTMFCEAQCICRCTFSFI